MTNTRLPRLGSDNLEEITATLTRPRLGKYYRAAQGNLRRALRLYVLNARVSAAFLCDLHYVEVALRNHFDRELAARFGPEWFLDPAFLALCDVRSHGILKKAQKDAARYWPKNIRPPPGKVIAELTFGFWHTLTDSRLEHTLWVPCLHKAFLPRKPPKRSLFNHELERLRQLRNRVAHHEPIFHLDLPAANRRVAGVGILLCPSTMHIMTATSTVRREIMALAGYCRRRDG